MDQPPTPPDARPPRRPRYRGTHPRRFDEKYKELNAQKYPDAVRKISESGKTPAGTHRPICVREILELLAPRAGEVAVDCTLGYGAHAQEILPRLLPGGRLIGLDTDPIELPKTESRLRAMGFPSEALTICHTNFAGLPRALASLELRGVDLVLADLGCSSMQFDNPARGFSFKLAGPLDLRMNSNKGRPASGLLATLDEAKLARILTENSDEPHADLLAQAIVRAQAQRPLQTTTTLTEVIRRALSRRAEAEVGISCRRVFQALRIEVNDEFSALEMLLRTLPDCLNAGARVAVLTFHSGEDRRVKKAFQIGAQSGIYARVADDVIRPSTEEVRANPRASSAKMRWAVRAESARNG